METLRTSSYLIPVKLESEPGKGSRFAVTFRG